MTKRRKTHDDIETASSRKAPSNAHPKPDTCNSAGNQEHHGPSSSSGNHKSSRGHSGGGGNYRHHSYSSRPRISSHSPAANVASNDFADYIPLPIQNFLWRQTSPFVKPPLGKARDSTQMEQREACKSFEKVMVQNNIFGQSPSLTEAIGNINRWQLIRTAFPFVLKCTASLLANKKSKDQSFNKLGACETKLLYSLHWILMDAAEECADGENEAAKQKPLPSVAVSPNLLKPIARAAVAAISSSTRSSAASAIEQQSSSSQSLATVAAVIASAAAAPAAPQIAHLQNVSTISTSSATTPNATTSPQMATTQGFHLPQQASLLSASSSSGGVSNIGANNFMPSASPSSMSTCAGGGGACDKSALPVTANRYLLPISSIQMFVYLFAPMIEGLKHSEFLTSFRLENGAKLWEPLFEHKLANVKCLTAPVKPAAAACMLESVASKSSFQRIQSNASSHPPLQATLSVTSDDEQRVVLKQQQSSSSSSTKNNQQSSIDQRRKSSGAAPEHSPNSIVSPEFEVPQIKLATPHDNLCADRHFMGSANRHSPVSRSAGGAQNIANLPYATYLDVAVIRCLFVEDWPEAAVYWALVYVSNRLTCAFYDTDFDRLLKQDRVRSKSLSAASTSEHFIKSITSKLAACSIIEPAVKIEMFADNDSGKHASQKGSKLPADSSGGKQFLKVDNQSGDNQQRNSVRRLSFTSGMASLASQLSKKTKKSKKSSADVESASRASSSGGGDPTTEDVQMRDAELDIALDQELKGEHKSRKATFERNLEQHTSPAAKRGLFRQQTDGTTVSEKLTSSYLLEQMQTESLRRFERLVRSQSVPSGMYYSPFATKETQRAQSAADANAASGYADAEGRIDLIVVLRMLRSVSEREFVCSPRVIEKLESLLARLMGYGMLKRQFLLARRANKASQSKMNSNKECKQNLLTTFTRDLKHRQAAAVPMSANQRRAINSAVEAESNAIHKTFVCIVFNILRRLGCPNNCDSTNPHIEQLQLRLGSARQQQQQQLLANDILSARNLRAKADDLLEHLCAYNTKNFTSYITESVQAKQLARIIATLHCVLGFCRSDYIASVMERHKAHSIMTPSASGSNLSQSRFSGSLSSPRFDSTAECQSHHTQPPSQQPRASAFTFTHAHTRQASSESNQQQHFIAHRTVVSSCFKLLIARMTLVSKELCTSENIPLFCDIRRFITCVRDNYADIFRTTVLSALIDSARLVSAQQSLTKQMQQQVLEASEEATNNMGTNKIASNSTIDTSSVTQTTPTAKQIDVLTTGKQQSTVKSARLASAHSIGEGSSANIGKSPKSAKIGPQDNQDASQQQGAGLLSFSKAKRKLEQVFGGNNAVTRPKIDTDFDSDSNIMQMAADGSARSPTPTSAGSGGVGGGSSGVGGKFKQRRSRSQQSTATAIPDASKPTISAQIANRNLMAAGSQQLINQQLIAQYRRTFVEVRRGIANFNFLMESCAPGDCLDGAMLAALLDLNGPIAVRAAVFLECANFVHRCNRGQWPSWMRFSAAVAATTFQQRPSCAGFPSKSSAQRTARNNTLLYRAAGRAFYSWAEAVGTRLEDMLAAEAEIAANKLSPSQLDSPLLPNMVAELHSPIATNPTLEAGGACSPGEYLQASIAGKTCPFALKLAACQLLLEVTAFLRETCRYLPPTVSHAQQAMSSRHGEKSMASIYDVSRAVTANRRWSMALSSLGFGQLPASLSIISGTVGGGAGNSSAGDYPDRRISFVLHETNDENEEDEDADCNGSTGQHGQEKRRSSGAVGVGDDAAVRRMTSRHQIAQTNNVASCLLRSSGVIEPSGGTHRRKSIKLRKPMETSSSSASAQSKSGAVTTTAAGSFEVGKRTKFATHEFDEQLEGSDGSGIMRRSDSIRSKRRVSGLSERSDTSDGTRGPHHINNQSACSTFVGGGNDSVANPDSPINASDDEPFANNEACGGAGGSVSGPATASISAASERVAAAASEAEDSRLMSHMPWFRAISLVNKSINCTCLHAPSCKHNCFKSQQEACRRLVAAVALIYDGAVNNDEIGEYAAATFEAQLHEVATSGVSSAANSDLQASMNKLDSSRASGGELSTAGNSEQNQTQRSTANLIEHQKYVGKKRDKKAKKDGGFGVGSVSPAKHAASAKQQATAAVQQQNQPQLQVQTPSFAMLMRKKALIGSYNRKQDVSNKVGVESLFEKTQIFRYIQSSVRSLVQNPMSTLLKGAVILPRESFVEMLSHSWNLLLEDDQLLARTAAVTFIVSGVKCPAEASKLLLDEMKSNDAARKIAAMNKFYAIWDSRYQCWHKMEEGAYIHFKMAPPSIDFTLPSPKIAQESMPVVDPPWQPRKTSKVEEASINQDQTVQKSFVTATKTRRKQQIELVTKALREKYDKLREEREAYPITSVPITYYAAYEPGLGHPVSSGDGGDADAGGAGGSGAGGVGSSANVPTSSGVDEDAQTAENRALYHMKIAHALFPTCLCQGAIVLINALEDSRVTYEGSAVYEVATKVIWCCLVEDPALFLRHFFERLTRQEQSTIFQVIRRLIRFMPRLPSQAAYTLYNYLIGLIIYYIRLSNESSQKIISDTLSVLCLTVPSVYGLFLKDLKQILRKEQCDHNLLITANVPSAKKIIVHGADSSGIPSQFPIDETTQFYDILIDSLEFFGIEKTEQNHYFLYDCRTDQMHNLQSYVRDFYSFKRSQHPQLQLKKKDPSEAFDILQRQELVNHFMEFGKVSMAYSIVKSPHLALQRVLFLHEELMKLPTFPRKCLETKFYLFRGTLGQQILSTDRLHKICWVRLFARMFETTSNFFLQLADLHLFLNSICGVFVLHCEEATVTRLCLSTFINAAYQYKNIFASDGFVPIMPTIVQVYSNHQNNTLLCRSIEFTCKQFYIMHRKPFMLQMFGSVAPLLNTAEVMQQASAANNPLATPTAEMLSQLRNAGNLLSGISTQQASSNLTKQQDSVSERNPTPETPLVKVQSPTSGGPLATPQSSTEPLSASSLPVSNSCTLLTNSSSISAAVANPTRISPLAFFKLLQSLEKAFKDPLDILELVEAEKPLKSLDFCYQNDKETIEILDIISLCVTVTAYASDSPRSTQMLIILDAVVPLYMKHLQATSAQRRVIGKPAANKSELQKIQAISVCIRTLIVNCEGLTRNFSGPQRAIDFRSSSIRRDRRRSPTKQSAAAAANQRAAKSVAAAAAAEKSNLDNSDEADSGNQPSTKRVPASASIQAPKHAKILGSATSAQTSGGISDQNARSKSQISCDESDLSRAEFVLARGTLLNLVAEFLALSTPRFVESMKKHVELHQKHQSYDLLDTKSHLRLAEIANSLLKLASVDPSVMSCCGLIRYMNEFVPNTEWRQESIRPALIMILKRLDKTFNRISKKTWIKRSTDWVACKQLLRGAYLTFVKHPYIVHLPHLKSLISCCQNIVLGEGNLLEPLPSALATLNSSSVINNAANSSSSSSSAQQHQASPNSFYGLSSLPGALNGAVIGVAVGGSAATNITAIAGQQPTHPAVSGNPQHQVSNSTGSSTSNASQSLVGQASIASTAAIGLHQTAVTALAPATATSIPNQPQQPLQQQQSSALSLFAQVANTIAASTRTQQQHCQIPSIAERLASVTAPPSSQGFSLVTLRLIAMQLLHSSDGQTLESYIGPTITSPEKLEATLLNLIYPMCIRVCSGARETPKLRANDVSYIVNLVLSLLAPLSASAKSCNPTSTLKVSAAAETSQFILSKLQTTIGGGSAQAAASALGGIVSAGSVSAQSAATFQAQQLAKHPEAMRIGLLGLKIVCVCFEQQLANEWVRISRVIVDLASTSHRSIANPALWDFLEFTAVYRFPLFILLEPFICCKLDEGIGRLNGEAAQFLQYKQLLEAKICAPTPIECRNKSFAFVLLSAELKALKDHLTARRCIQLDRTNGLAGIAKGGAVPDWPSSNSGASHKAGAYSFAGGRQPSTGGGGNDSGNSASGGEHFNAYHRLSAAIASLTGQSGASTATQNGANEKIGPSSIASALLAGKTGLAVNTSKQQSSRADIISPRLNAPGSSPAPSLDSRLSQSSIRLSSAQSREEARKLFNHLSRKTSLTGRSLVGTSCQSTSKQQTITNENVSNDGKQIIDSTALMSVFPPKKAPSEAGGGILKSLINTIDRQHQKRQSQCPPVRDLQPLAQSPQTSETESSTSLQKVTNCGSTKPTNQS